VKKAAAKKAKPVKASSSKRPPKTAAELKTIMMAKVRFAEKAKKGLRGKTTSKLRAKGKAKPATKKPKPPTRKKPVVKAKAVAKPAVAAKPKTVAKPKLVAPPKVKAPKPAAVVDQSLLKIILSQLEDAKAEDIVSISLDGKTAIADNMVVATGRSNRHVGAIADQLVDKLKAAGHRHIRVEGMDTCDWVLVDAVDVIIHLFRPEVRSFYNLEKLWSEHSPQEPHAE
jgi:ribosome-associated protein